METLFNIMSIPILFLTVMLLVGAGSYVVFLLGQFLVNQYLNGRGSAETEDVASIVVGLIVLIVVYLICFVGYRWLF